MEAVVEANHRALAGDANAGLHPADFEAELPLVALTCIDPRLNAILPQVLGIPPEQFIWLRNAGNILTGPLSSTVRSMALACAIKGGKEIAIIGHTDCQVGKTSAAQLLDQLRAVGVERHLLPDNLTEYFGLFGSPRQNVIKAAEIARSSPLLAPKVPVHGLLVDIETGKVEWLVNGYQTLEMAASPWNPVIRAAEQTVDALRPLADFHIGEMKFPETKIGEIASHAATWLQPQVQPPQPQSATGSAEPPPLPPKPGLPPPIRPRIHLRKNRP